MYNMYYCKRNKYISNYSFGKNNKGQPEPLPVSAGK